MQEKSIQPITVLPPLDYHLRVRDYIQKEEKKVWDFFSDKKNKQKEIEDFKLSLLKNTYRLDSETNPTVFEALEQVKETLSFNHPCTLYQNEGGQELNAGIVFTDGEAHIVLSGAIISKLDLQEMIALLGHEISHAVLWEIENREFEITSKIITSIANDYSNNPSFHETARMFDLYSEIYADKGALKACGDKDVVIKMLLKVSTGLDNVSPKNYLKQAKEILKKESKGSEGYSHPENYIRALATDWFHDAPETADQKIRNLIHGKLDVERLDIFQQEKLTVLTKKIIQIILSPSWFQTDTTEQLAKDYFKDFNFDSKATLTEEESNFIIDVATSTKEYLAYVIMDFCMVDEELSVLPFSQGFNIASQFDLEKILEKIVIKELKLSKKKFSDLKKQWEKDIKAV